MKTLLVDRRLVQWEEHDAIAVNDETKISRCFVTYQLSGDIEGESSLIYSMLYLPNHAVLFSGFESVRGNLLGGQGAFILTHSGTFDAEQAAIAVALVPASAMGSVAGLSGGGEIVSHIQDPTKGQLTLRLAGGVAP